VLVDEREDDVGGTARELDQALSDLGPVEGQDLPGSCLRPGFT
jgi:hypothetical protein